MAQGGNKRKTRRRRRLSLSSESSSSSSSSESDAPVNAVETSKAQVGREYTVQGLQGLIEKWYRPPLLPRKSQIQATRLHLSASTAQAKRNQTMSPNLQVPAIQGHQRLQNKRLRHTQNSQTGHAHRVHPFSASRSWTPVATLSCPLSSKASCQPTTCRPRKPKNTNSSANSTSKTS